MTPEELEQILAILEATPNDLEQIVGNLSADSLTRKPSHKNFSILEIVCHLRDLEAEGYIVRIERIVAEETPVLPDINGSQLAIDRRYNEQDLAAALGAFRSVGPAPLSW